MELYISAAPQQLSYESRLLISLVPGDGWRRRTAHQGDSSDEEKEGGKVGQGSGNSLLEKQSERGGLGICASSLLFSV